MSNSLLTKEQWIHETTRLWEALLIKNAILTREEVDEILAKKQHRTCLGCGSSTQPCCGH